MKNIQGKITFFLKVFFYLGQVLGSIFVSILIVADLWQNGIKTLFHSKLWLSLGTISLFILISQYMLKMLDKQTKKWLVK